LTKTSFNSTIKTLTFKHPSLLRYHTLISTAFFASLEWKGGNGFEKRKKEPGGRIENIESGGLWGLIFLHHTKSSSF